MALAFLALTMAYLGTSIRHGHGWIEALSEGRRLRHGLTLAHVLMQANYVDWVTRSPMTHVEEALALSTEHGFAGYLGWAQAFRGRALIELGRAQEAITAIMLGLAELRAGGDVANTPMPLTWLAEAHAALDQPTETRSCLVEAARFVETSDERVSEAELLHRIPGDLLNAAVDLSGAERHYRQAIAVAERQSAKLFQLRASTSLARLWRDQGKRAEARDLLAPIYHWFTEGFDAPDLKDAKSLLDELA